MQHHIDFAILEQELPPIIWRARWDELAERFGLPFKRSYMQNLDSEGRGPKRFTLRGRVGYLREDLIAWLNTFMSQNTCNDDVIKLDGWL